MSNDPITTVRTPQGKIFRLAVIDTKPAQRKGVIHFIGFTLPDKEMQQTKISVTGEEVRELS